MLIIDFPKFDPLTSAEMAFCVNLGPKCRVASRPCTRPVVRKPAFLKKIWPRKIAL